ncbi:hypothetical protein FAK_20620 [Desulfoferula mesophila]|uniref:Uncharacterized protein n=1 Tax=Desulfoferula mesophila TaxID=3058419 RepID=A0AAU9EM32_9BACT|nr:hypothetical protein FAK_20620 [Desulfoferula mesophilus]
MDRHLQKYRAKETDVTKLESSINWLNNPEALRRDGKSDLAEAAEEFLDAVRDGYGINLWYVYTGEKSPNVDKHIAVYNQNRENIENRRVIRH